MSGDPLLLIFVRPLRELVGLREWVVHVVPVPDPDVVLPEVLTAYCGARFAPGTVELLTEPRGMPCVRCLALAPISSAHRQLTEGQPIRRTRSADDDHVGQRFTRWGLDVEPRLSAAEKAVAYDAFAVEFESLPPHREPDAGWAEGMAYLCRRIARRHRGDPVEEWVPAWERQKAKHDGRTRQAS
jgi:hypothetical protein